MDLVFRLENQEGGGGMPHVIPLRRREWLQRENIKKFSVLGLTMNIINVTNIIFFSVMQLMNFCGCFLSCVLYVPCKQNVCAIILQEICLFFEGTVSRD